MKSALLLAALSVAVLPCSFARAADPAPTAAKHMAKAEKGSATREEEIRFVKYQYSMNMLDKQIAEKAQQSHNADIKSLGEEIIAATNRAEQRLTELGTKYKIDVSKDMEPVQAAQWNHFNKLQGRDFDVAFVINGTAMHTQSVLWQDYLAHQSEDADIKTYTTNHLPAQQNILRHFERIAAEYIGVPLQSSLTFQGEAETTAVTPIGNGANESPAVAK